MLSTGAERDLSTLMPRGRLRFGITPAAEVTVDTRGTLADVAVGEYPIRIQRRGYPDFMDRVQVAAGPEQVVRFAYNFATGSWVRR